MLPYGNIKLVLCEKSTDNDDLSVFERFDNYVVTFSSILICLNEKKSMHDKNGECFTRGSKNSSKS